MSREQGRQHAGRGPRGGRDGGPKGRGGSRGGHGGSRRDHSGRPKAGDDGGVERHQGREQKRSRYGGRFPNDAPSGGSKRLDRSPTMHRRRFPTGEELAAMEAVSAAPGRLVETDEEDMPDSFLALGVDEELVAILGANGIDTPFAVQGTAIPAILKGQDLCVRAPAGSGKTLAFGLPIMMRVGKASSRRPRALILSPTRELADQIRRALGAFGSVTGRWVGAVYGGVSYRPQIDALQRGTDVLVATPGRLHDLIERGSCSLSEVTHVVIDEADRMADMGFLPEVEKLLDQVPENRQTLLLSATLDGDVAHLTRRFQRDPVRIEVGDGTPDADRARHLFWSVHPADRVPLLVDMVHEVGPTMVFCRTRAGVDRLADELSGAGLGAETVHGGLTQRQRDRGLQSFHHGRSQVLIATDVAARGIHVDGVACVIHHDPPDDGKSYQHRSGRTARAGQDGVVVSFVSKRQKHRIDRMARDLRLDTPFTNPSLAELMGDDLEPHDE